MDVATIGLTNYESTGKAKPRNLPKFTNPITNPSTLSIIENPDLIMNRKQTLSNMNRNLVSSKSKQKLNALNSIYLKSLQN